MFSANILVAENIFLEYKNWWIPVVEDIKIPKKLQSKDKSAPQSNKPVVLTCNTRLVIHTIFLISTTLFPALLVKNLQHICFIKDISGLNFIFTGNHHIHKKYFC